MKDFILPLISASIVLFVLYIIGEDIRVTDVLVIIMISEIKYEASKKEDK